MSTGQQYVYSGVLLKCDKGALPTPLTVLPRPSRIRGQYQATEIDLVPGVNIKPFGACAITQGPCVPLPTRWVQVHQGALRVGGVRPLLETSKCLCGVGGQIAIFMTAAAAEQAVREDQAHEASDQLKTASLVLAVGALACAIGGLFFPPLELAAVALAEAAEATFVASVGIDVGVFVAHPTAKNGLVVVGDAVGIVLGAAVGKYVVGPLLGKAASALAKKEV